MAFLKAVAQSVWDTGTSNEDVLISPAKLTAAIATHAGIGFNPSPTRTDITGSVSDLTERKNTSSYLMEITIETLNAGTVQVSDDDGSTWSLASEAAGSDRHIHVVKVFPGQTWRPNGFAAIGSVVELV
jgi:hypothetical protein